MYGDQRTHGLSPIDRASNGVNVQKNREYLDRCGRICETRYVGLAAYN